MSVVVDETAQRRLERYLSLAARAREAASRAVAQDLREGYLGLAQAWEDLAEQVEREVGRIDSPVPRADLGAVGRVICDKCGEAARVTRRTPHPTRGPKYELQTFLCPKCAHVQTRDAEWRAEGAGQSST
jgi:hypothetical protein